MAAERGLEVDHTTIYRWVIKFTPEHSIIAQNLIACHIRKNCFIAANTSSNAVNQRLLPFDRHWKRPAASKKPN